jgi:MFS family permease
MGTVYSFSFLPVVAFSLIGGVVADRFPRLGILIVSDLVRGLNVCAVSVLAATGHLALWHILTASLLFGLAEAFFQPAFQAVIPGLVEADDIASANAVLNIGKQIIKISGPMIGALIVETAGASFAFAVDGVSFFISALFLSYLIKAAARSRLPSDSAERASMRSLGKEIGAGFKTVMRLPWVWATIVIAALGNVTLAGPLLVALPFLVKDHLAADVRAFGLANSFFALGTLIGSVWVSRDTKASQRGLWVWSSWTLGGWMMIILSQAISSIAFFMATAALGCFMAIFQLIWLSTLQRSIPQEQLGRVISIDNFGSYIFIPLGYSLTGWAVASYSASAVFLLGGVITIILGVIALASRPVRYFGLTDRRIGEGN